MSEPSSESQSLLNPFPGLRAFKDTESHLFFGREEHIEDVLSKLKNNHFVAVVGTSGTGKSSLIKAGVLPAIAAGKASHQSENWEVVSMNPGSSPLQNLADAICQKSSLSASVNIETFKKRLIELMSTSTLGLVQAMRPVLAKNTKLLILIDQFEEVFRFAKEDEAEAKALYDQFVKLIIETVRQRDVPIYAILTLRSDFLGDCVDFEGLPEAINDGHYLVPRMNKAQMKRAITGPIYLAKGKISPRLIQHITLDLGSNPDQLPVLQHAMMRCWDYWKNNAVAGEPMDLQHFEAIGDLRNALSTHANEAYDELDAPQKQVIKKVFKALTTKKTENRGIRRPMSLSQLALVTEASKEDIIRVLKPFQEAGRSFILPGSDIKAIGSTIYDISHESLMRGWGKLRNWVDEEMESTELYLRISTAALLHDQGAAGLWRDPELQLAIDWKEEQQPILPWAELYNDQFVAAINFIEDSKKAAIIEGSKKTRRTRFIRLAISVFIIVVTLLAGWALVQTNIAEQKSAEAQQKSEEAIEQKKIAESSKDEALLASTAAQKSSEKAKEQAVIASEQARIADEQKQIAQTEKGKAESAANLAISKQKLADQKSKEAIEQKRMADAASAEANRLRLVAISQNLAYSSLQVTQNPELAALLAIESYSIAKATGGNLNSASLYNSAFKALEQVSTDYSPKVFTLNHEAISFESRNNTLCTVDRSGNYKTYSETDYSMLGQQTSKITATELNTAYINPLKDEYVFGLNSFEIQVIQGENIKNLYGHSGLVRAVAFREVNPTLISGGRDAKLILWNNDGSHEQMKFDARIKTISALADSSSVLVGCENGIIYRVNLTTKTQTEFASKPSVRVEALSQTADGTIVAIGYSDGSTRLYSANGIMLKELSGLGSVVSLQMNKAKDVLAIAYSGRLIRLYSLSNLSTLAIEIKMERPIKEIVLQASGSEIFVSCTDRSIHKYPVKADWYINQLQSKRSRTLNEEEWETFVGGDIPFKPSPLNSAK
jgi:WD40 repeat protein/energy-coupling factor transporter ATP-binding protein EcfA2